MNEQKIRKARKQDISRIAEIIVFGKRVAYRDIFRDDIGSFNELQVLAVAEEILGNPALLERIVVYDDGIVKGVIAVESTGRSAEISNFYVEPFFKGEGIGTSLLQYVISEMKSMGLSKLFLWVLEENLPARRFYEKAGFRSTGDSKLLGDTGKIDLYYELLL